MTAPRRDLPPVLATLLLASSLAAAEPARRAPARAEAWAILLASTGQRPEAEAKLQAMQQAKAFAFLKPAEGYPRVIESASLPGLEPGLHTVVLGVCGSRKLALSAQARVRPAVGDVYLKRLTGPAPLACPEPVDLKTKLPRDARRIATVPFEGSPGLTLDVYEGHARTEMECTTYDLILRLVHEGRVLAEETLPGQCGGVCTEEAQQKGREELEALRKAVERGEEGNSALDYNFTECMTYAPRFVRALDGLGNPLLLVTDPKAAAHDFIRNPLRLVGVGCGRLALSDDFMGPEAYLANLLNPVGDVTGLRARPATPGDAGWKHFSLWTPVEKWFAGFAWNDERCAWVITHEQE